MSEIEIPDEAVKLAKVALIRGKGYPVNDDGQPYTVSGEIMGAEDSHQAKQAERALTAAYPSIRCQVLESVVEDVARAMGDYSVYGWKSSPRVVKQRRLAEARKLLGLTSEGEDGGS